MRIKKYITERFSLQKGEDFSGEDFSGEYFMSEFFFQKNLAKKNPHLEKNPH